MTVKELIVRLLEEDMNTEIFVATTDELRQDETTTKKNNVIFPVEEVEHWGGRAYIGFTDWRKGGQVMEPIELFDGKKANVTEIGGYDDGWYWDYVAHFTVEDQHFLLNIAGSYSGWIRTYEAITIDNEPPKLTGVEYDFNDYDAIKEEQLINFVKKYYELFVSKKAKISYVYAEDDDYHFSSCHVHIDGVKEEEETF